MALSIILREVSLEPQIMPENTRMNQSRIREISQKWRHCIDDSIAGPDRRNMMLISGQWRRGDMHYSEAPVCAKKKNSRRSSFFEE